MLEETLAAELDGEVLLDEEEMALEEDDVGCAELEDEVWLEEATCCECEVSMTDQIPLLFVEAGSSPFLKSTEICDRADDIRGGGTTLSYLASRGSLA